MSLVGPRPLPPEEDALVHGAYRRRLQVPPGITGPWQVRGSWRVPIEEMVELDYGYAASLSLWTDLKLIVLTIPAVLRARGV
jgi:lipopolysaccharide/colanic/teichoic acid biosynthesis glycosyltransferase